MSIESGRLSASPILHSAASSLPSQSVCMISAGFSDQNSKHGPYDHNQGLVEKEGTHMGGLFSPIENFLHQHAKEEQAHDDLQSSVPREGIDEIQSNKHAMMELLPIQASEEKCKEESEKKGSAEWHGISSDTPVTPIASIGTASVASPGKNLLMELWSKELDKEEEIDETEKERKVTRVLEEESVDENDNIQQTQSINSISNCQSVVPFPNSNCGEHSTIGNPSKEANAEQKGKVKVGRKRKAIDRSINFRLSIEYEAKETPVRGGKKKVKPRNFDGDNRYQRQQKQKRGRPKKVKDQFVDGTEGKEEQARKRGRPKKMVKDQSVNANESEGELKLKKRGRPKKVKDQLLKENEYEGEQKRKRGRPKKVMDPLSSDKSGGVLTRKRGRPKKVQDPLDDNNKYVEKPKQRKKKRRRLTCCFILC